MTLTIALVALWAVRSQNLRVPSTNEKVEAMTLQEFAALKAGDKIENHMAGAVSVGTVKETTPSGLWLTWAGGDLGVPFFYSVNSTSWFHWSKAE